jgi:hypothetical protein
MAQALQISAQASQTVSTNSLLRDINAAALWHSCAQSMTSPMQRAISCRSWSSKQATAHRSHTVAHA